jgi:hypothetical protein
MWLAGATFLEPTALAACSGFDLCHKYILYLHLYLYFLVFWFVFVYICILVVHFERRAMAAGQFTIAFP